MVERASELLKATLQLYASLPACLPLYPPSQVAEELEYLGYVVELRRNNPTDPGYRHNIDKGCLEKLRHLYIVCHGRRDGSVTVSWPGGGSL